MSAYRALNAALRSGSADRLRDELRHWGEQLGPQWSELADLGDEMMFRIVRRKLKPTQLAVRNRNRENGVELAERQLAKVISSARYGFSRVVLEPTELLHPDLLKAPNSRFLRLESSFGQVTVRLEDLRVARVALRKKNDLAAWLTTEALHFRWRDGVGGLDLRHQRPLSWSDERRVLCIKLIPTPHRSSGAWLGDVLTELGWTG